MEMSEKKVPVEETLGSAQNENEVAKTLTVYNNKTFPMSNDKTFTVSNSFHQFGFQEEHNATLDDHLLRHAHR
jgi:hypothetical protein